MSCGMNIPLSSIVEAIVNDYADVLAGEVIKRISLDSSMICNGTLTDATIRGGLTLDETAKGALCSALQDCIAAKIQDELTCERDNYVTDFSIDKANDRVTITMKFGEKFSISKEELASWLGTSKHTDNTGNTAAGVKSGELLDDNGKKIIRLTNDDDSTVDIDVDGLSDKFTDTAVRSGRVKDNTLTLELSDGSTVDIDMSALAPQAATDNDTKPTRAELDGNTFKLHLSDGSTVELDLSALNVGKSTPRIVSGSVTGDTVNNAALELVRDDNSKVVTDLSDLLKMLLKEVTSKNDRAAYTIKTVDEDYQVTTNDIDDYTIIRANKNADQIVTLPQLDDSYIGKSVVIRKTNGSVDTHLTINATLGMTISPADSTPLRRVGSSIVAIYTGNNNWDIFGELP